MEVHSIKYLTGTLQNCPDHESEERVTNNHSPEELRSGGDQMQCGIFH